MAEVTDLTYGQLRQRIADELDRSDLDASPPTESTSVIHRFVLDRVLYYSKEFFYNAQFIDTSKSTAVGEAWVDLPDGWQGVNYLRLLYGSVWTPVGHDGKPVDFQRILESDIIDPRVEGLPSFYALHQNPTGGKMAIRFDVAASDVWQLEITMDKPPAAPTADADVSFWTTDAQTLIISSVCEQICRRKINRPLKADEHAKTRQDEELALISKSIRIRGGVRFKAYW